MDSIHNETYKMFYDRAAQATDLGAALALMSWDQEVMMPQGAAERRASQLSTLAGLLQNFILNDLKPAADHAALAAVNDLKLSDRQRLNITRAKQQLDRQSKLPASHVAAVAQASAAAQSTWETARANADFALFAPALSQLVDLKRQEAELYGYTTEPYDALMEEYEPGARATEIEALFAGLRGELQSIVQDLARAPQVDDAPLMREVPKDRQWEFSLGLLRNMGYDFNHGRQDLSSHPFSTSFGPTDVRVTTRMDAKDITMITFSTIHEGGHALYEQGLAHQQYGLPEAEACSLSIHESMSRIWENNVGRSLPFWQHHFAALRNCFDDGLPGWTALDAYRAVNKVQPSLIRVAADELTYHFHIMIRFEIERDLINGKLQVADLPKRWNQRYKDYLGVSVPNDREGVLQDIHWSHGSFGYFPTYSLGSFYAAQFMATFRRENPDVDAQFGAGNFEPFRAWLTRNVFAAGRLYNSNELCHMITGENLQVQYFLDYIKAKLAVVYGVSA